jgi:hypothetical protein
MSFFLPKDSIADKATDYLVDKTVDGVVTGAKETKDAIVDGAVDKAKFVGNTAATTVGDLGAGVYHLSNTDVGKYALAGGAGLFAARMLAKKYLNKDSENNNKKPEKKLAWMSRGPKMESVISEQNENLPRYPTMAYTTKIPKSPRSISGFFMRRRQNVYKTNAAQAGIENSRKIAAKNIKDTAAVTGVDRVIGKLVG